MQSAAIVGNLPLTYNGDSMYVGVEGIPDPPPDQQVDVIYRGIGPGYFSTMGIPLVRGRDFTEQDTTETAYAVVVSEKTAQHFWPGQDPIGKRLKPGATTSDVPWREVIAVVKDVRQNDFVAAPKLQMYMSYRQLKFLVPNALVVRTSVDPMSLAVPLRNAVWAVDKNQPVSRIQSMEAIVAGRGRAATFQHDAARHFRGARARARRRRNLWRERTREIGIRIALGAQRGDVLSMTVMEGLKLVAAGVAIGLIAALVLTRVMTSLLFGERDGSDYFRRYLAPLGRDCCPGQLYSGAAGDTRRSDGRLALSVALEWARPSVAVSNFRCHLARRPETRQPPAIAPTTKNGSAPFITRSGRGVSDGACERSSSQAKKRTKARRFCVP